MPTFTERFLNLVDSVNDWAGKVASYVALIIMINVVYEVVLRYFLNSPTIWATELNEMLLCGYAALAGGYALLHGAHVSVEIVQERLNSKNQAFLNLITYLFGFAFLAILIWMSWDNAMEAWEYSERSESLFAPPLFPVKIMIPIGGGLFFLQLMAQYIREIRKLKATEGRNPIDDHGTRQAEGADK